MAVAGPSIQIINPNIDIRIIRQLGYVTNDDYSRYPRYAIGSLQSSQVQQLTASELRQTEGLNLSAETRGIYLYGTANGVTRAGQNGGDIIVLPDLTQWLVTSVLEQWTDWVKVAITRQTNLIPLDQGFLLQEDGFYILTEQGFRIII